jgi:transcriptional regulator with XRE-family HTH domain
MKEYDFAERLRQARQRAGWSQTELGKRSGVHHMAISRLERGDKKDVTGGTLRKLAIALGVSADWLLGIEDEETELLPAAVAHV